MKNNKQQGGSYSFYLQQRHIEYLESRACLGYSKSQIIADMIDYMIALDNQTTISLKDSRKYKDCLQEVFKNIKILNELHKKYHVENIVYENFSNRK